MNNPDKDFISIPEQLGLKYPEGMVQDQVSDDLFREFRNERERLSDVEISLPVHENVLFKEPETVKGAMTEPSYAGEDLHFSNADMTENTEISCTKGDVNFYAGTVSNNARPTITAPDGAVIMNYTEFNGDFPKSGGNAILNINDTKDVQINGVKFNAEDCYNSIEIGLSGDVLPEHVSICRCSFRNNGNNTISIFGTQDNAVIDIRGCHFGNVSNPLRISNRTNAENVVINIVDCKVDAWAPQAEYAKFICCQDYTSKDKEVENNVFGDGKITINFVNTTGPDGKKIEGYDGADTAAYVYCDKGGLIAYEGNESRFPVIKTR